MVEGFFDKGLSMENLARQIFMKFLIEIFSLEVKVLLSQGNLNKDYDLSLTTKI